MTDHHYMECGLSNVLIYGLTPEIDDEGDQVVTVPAINELHRVIAQGIVEHHSGISGEELRFLRTEMGMTQAELARLVHRDKQSVGRWERGENEIDSTSETVIRKHAIEVLALNVDLSIDQLAERSVVGSKTQPIGINALRAANDGATRYELRAA